MANKLRKMELESVDLVRAGANQEADICLFKSAEGAGQPSEAEMNIFERFIHWLRKNHTESKNEPQNPILKADQLERTEIYKSAIIESIQSIIADDSLTAAEKDSMVAKSLAEYHEAMIGLVNFTPDRSTPAKIDKSNRYDEIEEVQVKKWNPWHGADGRFTSGPGGAVGGVSSRTVTGGGISIHVKSGKEPKDGYMCAVYQDRAEWIKGDDVTNPEKRTAAIDSFMKKNADVLSDPDNYLGTWFDTESGNISLDISRNFKDKAEAISFASAHNEKAIWDVANMAEISTGGTGNNL